MTSPDADPVSTTEVTPRAAQVSIHIDVDPPVHFDTDLTISVVLWQRASYVGDGGWEVSLHTVDRPQRTLPQFSEDEAPAWVPRLPRHVRDAADALMAAVSP